MREETTQVCFSENAPLTSLSEFMIASRNLWTFNVKLANGSPEVIEKLVEFAKSTRLRGRSVLHKRSAAQRERSAARRIASKRGRKACRSGPHFLKFDTISKIEKRAGSNGLPLISC